MLADLIDSATPPQSTDTTAQPRVARHLDGDEVLSALQTVCDSLKYSAGIYEAKREAQGTGKAIIFTYIDV